MAITITEAYIETFEANVRHLAQQNISRLRMCISEVNKQSERHNWDRLKASQARVKPGPRAPSPQGGDKPGNIYNPDAGHDEGLEWSRRQTLIQAFDTGEIVEQEDVVQMLIDPKNASTENLVMNMARRIDDTIINAAVDDALIGDGTGLAVPAESILGDYLSEISLDFILEVDEVFQSKDVDPDEPRYFVIGPKQRRKLLQLIEVTSGDFQDKKALANGYLPNFLGFNWILSNRLTTDGAGTSVIGTPVADQRDCLAFTKKALGLHVAGDIQTRVAERSDMSFAWQLYLMMQMDATRVEDEHFVWCKLADTVT